MEDTRRSSRPRRSPGEPAAPPSGSARNSVFTLSEEETSEVGRSLAQSLRGGELILLDGELGSGKTAFARGIAAGLGIPAEDVSSPSFTLVQEYRGGRVDMVHVDLYRLEDQEDMASLGLEDILDSESVVVVEWGEKLPAYHRRNAITIRLYDAGEGSRRIELLPAASERPRRGDA